jgi:hypothetical protein
LSFFSKLRTKKSALWQFNKISKKLNAGTLLSLARAQITFRAFPKGKGNSKPLGGNAKESRFP